MSPAVQWLENQVDYRKTYAETGDGPVFIFEARPMDGKMHRIRNIFTFKEQGGILKPFHWWWAEAHEDWTP